MDVGLVSLDGREVGASEALASSREEGTCQVVESGHVAFFLCALVVAFARPDRTSYEEAAADLGDQIVVSSLEADCLWLWADQFLLQCLFGSCQFRFHQDLFLIRFLGFRQS